jgi:hypothetical protein
MRNADGVRFRGLSSAPVPQEESSMSDLIAVAYPTEAKADKVRKRLFELRKEYLITIGDAVITAKTDAGKIKLNQLMNITEAGAVSSSFRGLFIGLLFMNPLVGTAIGAASGALCGILGNPRQTLANACIARRRFPNPASRACR